MRRYIIIGSGAAGIAAVEAIRRRDPSGSILLLCEEAEGFYSRPGLAYYLTGELVEKQLFPFQEKDFQRLNVKRVHARVEAILPDQHRIRLHTGAELPYDRLLIATGAAAAKVQAPGITAEGVVKLDSLQDARHILKLTRKARSAVVVGGGITALEIVEALVAHRVKVHYFLRGDRYWGNVLDEGESRLVEQRLQEEGVQIHFQTEMAEVLEKHGRVAGMRTKDGRVIPCDIVGVAIGTAPRMELAVKAGIKTGRGILVDETMQTSAPDIFAAGDVAQVFDPFSGKSVLDSLWGPARDQGNAAGANMAGERLAYSKLVPFNVTRLAHLTTTIIGVVGGGSDTDLMSIARGDSETWRALPDAIAAQSGFNANRLRILVGENTLIGALVMGDQTLSHVLQETIARRVDISSIRSRLLSGNMPAADVIAEFWMQYKQRKISYAA